MQIIRHTPSLLTTIGTLTVPETAFRCYTLEDVCRALGFKIMKRTAIPEGNHQCILNMSKRFGRILPLIFNQDDYSLVDGRGVRFTGIRIHNGVNHENTEGCVLAGYEKGVDRIWKPAADDLTALLKERFGVNVPFPISIMNSQTA